MFRFRHKNKLVGFRDQVMCDPSLQNSHHQKNTDYQTVMLSVKFIRFIETSAHPDLPPLMTLWTYYVKDAAGWKHGTDAVSDNPQIFLTNKTLPRMVIRCFYKWSCLLCVSISSLVPDCVSVFQPSTES